MWELLTALGCCCCGIKWVKAQLLLKQCSLSNAVNLPTLISIVCLASVCRLVHRCPSICATARCHFITLIRSSLSAFNVKHFTCFKLQSIWFLFLCESFSIILSCSMLQSWSRIHLWLLRCFQTTSFQLFLVKLEVRGRRNLSFRYLGFCFLLFFFLK